MSKPKSLNSRLRSSLVSTRFRNNSLLLIIIILVAGLGTYLLVGSKAATPYADVSASQGNLTGCATTQTDPSSSSGQSVVFGGSNCGSGASCTTTLSSSDSTSTIAADIVSAPNGSTVCLGAGNYPFMTINGAIHTNYVTVEPASGAQVVVNGMQISDSAYLRIQGLQMTAGINARDTTATGTSHNLQFMNNTIGNTAYGIVVDGYSNTTTGVYNPIEHVLIQGNYFHDLDAPQACQINPATGEYYGAGYAGGQGVTNYGADDVTIADNIFKSIGEHFIQGGGGTIGMTVENNLFTGPQPADAEPCAHINVWQIWAGGSNDTFKNNVVIGSAATGTYPVSSNALMFETGPGGGTCSDSMTNTNVSNNLFVDQNESYEMQIMTTTNLQFTNNTIVGSAYGVALDNSESGCGPGLNATVTNNISVDNTAGSENFGYGGCTVTPSAATSTFPAQCITDYNVSQDKTAGPLTYTCGTAHNQVCVGSIYGDFPVTTHYVTGWTPTWQNTTWSLPTVFTAGTAYSTPADYYQPASSVTSSSCTSNCIPFVAGYQGTIGPLN